MADAASVDRQYSHEDRLQTRRAVWEPAQDGRGPQQVAGAAVAEAVAVKVDRAHRILEVGCGTGAFGQELAEQHPDLDVVATDRSVRMAELAAARGLRAVVADVQRLPFGDATFRAVVAMWMLYHVPDLAGGLAEIRRVLKQGGTLVAVTNGDDHLADLLAEAGGARRITGFSRENGATSLSRHFAEVAREDLHTRARFAGHAAAVDYLATFDPALARGLPHFDGPRTYDGATSVFVAR